MEIVIDIPEEEYKIIKNRTGPMAWAEHLIQKGTPLPKGHWIEHPHEAGPNWEYSRYECSECHDWAEDDSDYCPYCGAKMVEPQESEDKE